MSFMRAVQAAVARRAVAATLGTLCGLVVLAWPAVGTALAVPHIYWANRGVGTIGEASLDGTGVNQSFITDTVPGTQGIAVDGRHIYWANVQTNAIGRANLDGTGANPGFITGANEPAGVAVGSGRIFWTNIANNTIGDANVNGTGVNQSLISGAHGPAELAVDGQHIYWTNNGGTSIGRANLNGTGVNQNFITGIADPGGLAVDGQRIYWTSNDTIGDATLGGTEIEQGLITGAHGPTGLAVDGEHIYWANNDNATIGEANLDGTGVNQSFIAAESLPNGNLALSVPVAQLVSTVLAPFDNTPQGSLSAPATVSLANTGQRPLSLTGLSFAGIDPSDFLATTGTCVGDIAPGNSCQLQVYFSPQGQGVRSGTLQIATNDYADSPLQVQLSGTGAGLSAIPGPVGPTGPSGRHPAHRARPDHADAVALPARSSS